MIPLTREVSFDAEAVGSDKREELLASPNLEIREEGEEDNTNEGLEEDVGLFLTMVLTPPESRLISKERLPIASREDLGERGTEGSSGFAAFAADCLAASKRDGPGTEGSFVSVLTPDSLRSDRIDTF